MPPTIEESVEPSTLAAAAKLHFQPPAEPREVTPPAKPAAKEVAKEPLAKPAAKEPDKAEPPKKPDAKASEAPKGEEDAVFGTEAVKPQKKEAPKDEDFEASLQDEKKGMTEKAGAKWEQLRRSEKAAKDEARQAREELKTAAEARQESKEASQDAPKIEALTAENTALKAQLAEAEQTLSVAAFERSPKYRREVKEPIGEITKTVEDMAGRYDVSSKTLLAALDEDPKTRSATLAELAADFNEPDRIELYTAAKDMDRLRRKADAMRERAASDLSALEQEDKDAEDRVSAERTTAFTASVQRTWDESAKQLEFLRHHPSAPEWNAALDTARAESAGYVAGQDPIADGRMIAEAIQSRFIRKWGEHLKTKLAAVTEERDKLLERIEADNAHDPGLGGTHDDDAGHAEEGDENLTPGERAKNALGRMR